MNHTEIESRCHACLLNFVKTAAKCQIALGQIFLIVASWEHRFISDVPYSPVFLLNSVPAPYIAISEPSKMKH